MDVDIQKWIRNTPAFPAHAIEVRGITLWGAPL